MAYWARIKRILCSFHLGISLKFSILVNRHDYSLFAVGTFSISYLSYRRSDADLYFISSIINGSLDAGNTYYPTLISVFPHTHQGTILSSFFYSIPPTPVLINLCTGCFGTRTQLILIFNIYYSSVVLLILT